MAKKNVRDEPPKTQVTENAQLSDIVFILDKMELLLQAISDIDKNGRYKTVSADKKPDSFRHPFRQGECAGQPGSQTGNRGSCRRQKIRRGGGISKEIRDCSPLQRKPKYKPSKSRRNGKKN